MVIISSTNTTAHYSEMAESTIEIRSITSIAQSMAQPFFNSAASLQKMDWVHI